MLSFNMAANRASNIIGWDIGGAHLKAVLLNEKGEVVDCLQLPCPLWKGLDYLQRAIIDAQAQLNKSHALQALQIAPSGACHAITMTGELVKLPKLPAVC
jgi:(4-(4-[2-(gamma-L-glutamylamino)ethyl]phenoxymethyl)furan-2-yl)methanamine synthase